MLLCNACGIKWKRKHKATAQNKIKPGPKRSRPQHRSNAQRATSIAPAPTYPKQPLQQPPTPAQENESKTRSNKGSLHVTTGGRIPIQKLLNQPDERQRKWKVFGKNRKKCHIEWHMRRGSVGFKRWFKIVRLSRLYISRVECFPKDGFVSEQDLFSISSSCSHSRRSFEAYERMSTSTISVLVLKLFYIKASSATCESNLWERISVTISVILRLVFSQ